MGNTTSALADRHAEGSTARSYDGDEDDEHEGPRPAKRRRVQRRFSQESTIVVDDDGDWSFASSVKASKRKRRKVAASEHSAAEYEVEEQYDVREDEDGTSDRRNCSTTDDAHGKEFSLYGTTLHLAAAGSPQRLECHKELLLSKSRQPGLIEQEVMFCLLDRDLLQVADVDYGALRIFVVWLYTGRLESLSAERLQSMHQDPALQSRLYSEGQGDDSEYVAEEDLISLAIIAEHYDMPDLMNATMTETLARGLHIKQTFTAAAVNKAYRHLNRDSKMIDFLVRHAAENVNGASMPDSAAPFWSQHLGDVIRRLLEQPKHATALRDERPCTYHDHKDSLRRGKKCMRLGRQKSPPSKGSSSDLLVDMTTVLVGRQRQRIRAHTAFLCHSSQIFEDALNSQPAESSSEDLCLDTESVGTFSLFMSWMYTGELDDHLRSQSPSGGDSTLIDTQKLGPPDLISLYIFGDNWEIPALRNDVMSFVIGKIESTDGSAWVLITTCHEHIHLAFDALPKGSALLRFLVAEAAWLWSPGLLEQDLDDLPNDFLAGMLNTRPRVERRRREGTTGWTPWREDICIFHDHGSDDGEKQACHEKHRDLQQRLKAKVRYDTHK